MLNPSVQPREGLEDVNFQDFPLVPLLLALQQRGRAGRQRCPQEEAGHLLLEGKHAKAQHPLPVPSPINRVKGNRIWAGCLWYLVSARWDQGRWDLKSPPPPWRSPSSRNEMFSNIPGPIFHSRHAVRNMPCVPLAAG